MHRAVPFLIAALLASCASDPPLPIASGVYRFRQKSTEHPMLEGADLKATIDGRHIQLVNEGDSTVFPRGIVAQGNLLWHAGSRQWIISDDAADLDADEVGGCSDGPDVVDLAARIYWTC